MLDEIKITFLNGWNLKCTFPVRGGIQNLNLGYEINEDSSILSESLLKNPFNRSIIDYPSVLRTLTHLRGSINEFFFNDHFYEQLIPDDSIQFTYMLYGLQADIFGMSLNKYHLEMSFRLDGQNTIGYLKSKNYFMFKNFRFDDSYNNWGLENVENDDDLCFDFLLKIEL